MTSLAERNEQARHHMAAAYASDPDKFRKRARQWRADNPEISRQRDRSRRLVKRYGINLEQRDEMIARQGGHCAICPIVFSDKHKPCVDHCHESGRVRGILCVGCNRAIGRLGDTHESIMRVARYLEAA